MKKILTLLAVAFLNFQVLAQWQGTNPVYVTAGNVGIGTNNPVARLSIGDVTLPSQDGITWYGPDALSYGIYRTPGSWTAPAYQQLKFNFATGIILNPGTGWTKSYVDVQGGGLRVSTGNAGIGTTFPSTKLHVVINSPNSNYAAATYSDFSLMLQNSNSTNANLNILGFSDGAGWGIGHIGTIQTDQTNHYGRIFFSTRGSAGMKQQLLIDENGNVGIGSSSPSQKLTVNGTIYGKEVKVDLSVPGPDYVFEKSYSLPTLEEVKSYIDQNKHLPEVPTAKEMEKNGVMLGEMNMLLLKKVEELTLYIIEQEKRIKALEEKSKN